MESCVVCGKPATTWFNMNMWAASSVPSVFDAYCAEHAPQLFTTTPAITEQHLRWMLDKLWDYADLPVYAIERLLEEQDCPSPTLKSWLTNWLEG